MPDVHVPKLDEHGGGQSILKLALEVALISVGVFLGLAGEQYRERAHQRELSHEALQRFRTEILENRRAVADVSEYHLKLEKALDIEFSKPVRKRSVKDLELRDIDSDLALSLSAIYNARRNVDGLTGGIVNTTYLTPPVDEKSTMSMWGAILLYCGDIVIYEPRLLKMYDEVLPKIDKALGKKSH